MRHFFVINPHSFRRNGTLEQIQAIITNSFAAEFGTKPHIYISRYPRDAISAIYHYMKNTPADEIVRIYAVGGDGIHFDCLNGMVDFPNAELTNIPYGSANDFIRAFGETAKDNFRDIKNLFYAPSQPVDIISCGSNYAINDVAFGLESQCIIYANKILRRHNKFWFNEHAHLAYMLGALHAAFDKELRNQEYTVLMDGEDLSGCYTNITISNGAGAGGSYILNPYAVPNDGYLDVIFFNAVNNLETLNVMKDYLKGHFEKHSAFCFHRRFKRIEVKSNKPMRINLDGEAFYAFELALQIVPGHIKFFAPQGLEFTDHSNRAYKKGKAAI